jgi:hypothetical protein
VAEAVGFLTIILEDILKREIACESEDVKDLNDLNAAGNPLDDVGRNMLQFFLRRQFEPLLVTCIIFKTGKKIFKMSFCLFFLCVLRTSSML